MATVEQVVPVAMVGYVDVIGLVPSASPVLRVGIQHCEPVAVVLETGISSFVRERKGVDPEYVLIAVVIAVIIIRNAVAVITASLLPTAVLVLPVVCAPLLPGTFLLSLL